MSDEYIKTNDVVNAINVLLDNVDASEDAMNKFCDSMNDIQKVEIVRCKDCKHIKEEHFNIMPDGFSCELSGLMVEPEHYCSYGERADT